MAESKARLHRGERRRRKHPLGHRGLAWPRPGRFPNGRRAPSPGQDDSAWTENVRLLLFDGNDAG